MSDNETTTEQTSGTFILNNVLAQEPDLTTPVMNNLNLTWGAVKTLVEMQAKMAWQLKRPMNENEFTIGSWEHRWFIQKYLELSTPNTFL